MAYFHVIKGEQAGSTIELEEVKTYLVANDFAADIFLKLTGDLNFSFAITDGHVIFNTTDAALQSSQTNTAIEINQQYPLPFKLNIADTVVLFSAEAEISGISPTEKSNPALNKLDLENLEDFDITQDVAEDFLQDIAAATPLSNPSLRDKIAAFYYNCATSFKYYWGKVYKILGYWIYLIIAVFLGLFIAVFILIHQYDQEQDYEIQLNRTTEIRHQIQHVLINLPNTYANIKISRQDSGFVIDGILENEQLLIQLKALLAKVNTKITYRVLIFDQIKPVIIKILAQDDIKHPNVEDIDEGGYNIAISGITDDMSNIDNAEIDIHNRFGNVGQINTEKIFFVKDIETFLDKIPPEIQDQLSFEKNYAKGEINIQGLLDKIGIQKLEDEIEQFNKQHEGVVTIKLNVQDILQGIPFYVKEVYTGQLPWIVTDDGTKLYAGGSYKGIDIVAIDAYKVVFKKKFKFTLSMDELMELGPTSNTTTSATAAPCDRQCVLEQEKVTESQAISKEKKQLQELQQITTSNKNLAKDFQETIDNLLQDLATKEHEYNAYYNGRK